MAWCGGLGVDHGQKHDPGDEILVMRDLTNKGPLQKHYFGRIDSAVRICPLQWGHRIPVMGMASALMTARRTAGRVGSGGPLRACRFFFFPLCSLQSLMLEEGVGDHRHQGVPM